MKGILIAAQVETISTRRDRTVKIVLGTQELAPALAGDLLAMNNDVISIYLCPSTIDNREIEQVDKIDPDLGGKSQSQRIRNVLYKLFEQDKEGYKEFDAYYRKKTELYIEHLKSKIEP